MFEVVEQVEDEFKDEVGFWERLHLRRRFGVEVAGFLELTGEFIMDLAVSADDSAVCVVYYDETNGDLKYAEQIMQDSVWVKLTLDSRGVVGKYPAIDGSGGRHVSYYDATAGDLKYMYCAGNCTTANSWTIREVVDGLGRVGLFTEIAVDQDNFPHISYIDSTNKSLKYANRILGSWTRYLVEDPQEDLVASTSIAVDDNTPPQPHISYGDRSNGFLKYAKHSGSFPGGTWTIEKVPDPWDDVGLWNSIAVGVDDTVHISYSASDSLCEFKALKYAKGKP